MPLFSSPLNGKYANATVPNAWFSYEFDYLMSRQKETRTKVIQYKQLMKGFPDSMPAGVATVDIRMMFFYDMEDAYVAGGWSREQLEKHFWHDKQEIAFSSEWLR